MDPKAMLAAMKSPSGEGEHKAPILPETISISLSKYPKLDVSKGTECVIHATVGEVNKSPDSPAAGNVVLRIDSVEVTGSPKGEDASINDHLAAIGGGRSGNSYGE